MKLGIFLSNFISRIFLVVASFSFTLLGARYYSPADLDSLVLFQLATSFTLTIFSFGLQDIFIRETSLSYLRNKNIDLVIQTLLLVFIISLSTIFTILLLHNYFHIKAWFFYGIISGVCFSQIKLIISIFRGLDNIVSFTILQSIALSFPFVAGSFYLLLVNTALIQVNIEIVTFTFCGSVLFSWIILAYQLLVNYNYKFNIKYFYKKLDIIIRAKPLFVQSLIGIVIYQADTALLAIFSMQGIIGVYGVISRIINTIAIIREIYAVTVLRSLVIMLDNKDGNALIKYTNHTAKLLFIPMFFLLIGMFYFSDNLVVMVFGHQDEFATVLMRILLFTHLGFILFSSTDHLLIASHLERYVMFSSILAMLIFITAAPLSLYLFGPIGLAIVIVIQRNSIFILGRNYLKRYGNIVIGVFGRIKYM